MRLSRDAREPWARGVERLPGESCVRFRRDDTKTNREQMGMRAMINVRAMFACRRRRGRALMMVCPGVRGRRFCSLHGNRISIMRVRKQRLQRRDKR